MSILLLSYYLRQCSDINSFKEELHQKYKPPNIKLYSYGTKTGNSHITGLRVDISYLNAHAYSIGLAQSPHCSCGAMQETTLHMLNLCPLHASGRRVLFDYVVQLVSPFTKFNHRQNMYTLLYGYESDNN